ncbi:MAG: manganese efflux pump MntP family protein [Clostridia bacterium]|nr:manganese efflux pump MntP family protein [Clostridia bacterium]
MRFAELFLLAVALSMDAFAVAVCAGLTMTGPVGKRALIVGLYFGAFQAAMPLAGYLVAARFAGHILAYGHWIAFAVLCFLGGKMMAGSLRKEGQIEGREEGGKRPQEKEASLRPARMLPLALATSIDALAVGVLFAFLRVRIVPAVSFIGVTTLALSMAGVKVGSVFGARLQSKAEFAGGIILVLIGLKILLEHLGVIG